MSSTTIYLTPGQTTPSNIKIGNGPPVSGVTFTLDANDAKDTASFELIEKNNLQLATNDAKDTASFNLIEKNNLQLATNDAKDTASFHSTITNHISLATNDATDTASFTINANEAITITLVSNDAKDTASFDVTAPQIKNTNDGEIIPQWLIDKWKKQHQKKSKPKTKKAKKQAKQLEAILNMPIDEFRERVSNGTLTKLSDIDKPVPAYIPEDQSEKFKQQEQEHWNFILDQLMADESQRQQLDQAIHNHLDQVMTSHLESVIHNHLDQAIAAHRKRDDEEVLLTLVMMDE